jgi:hypothetical protein
MGRLAARPPGAPCPADRGGRGMTAPRTGPPPRKGAARRTLAGVAGPIDDLGDARRYSRSRRRPQARPTAALRAARDLAAPWSRR